MNWNEQGGAAFPFAATDPSNVDLQSSGMSLRDWFAGRLWLLRGMRVIKAIMKVMITTWPVAPIRLPTQC